MALLMRQTPLPFIDAPATNHADVQQNPVIVTALTAALLLYMARYYAARCATKSAAAAANSVFMKTAERSAEEESHICLMLYVKPVIFCQRRFMLWRY